MRPAPAYPKRQESGVAGGFRVWGLGFKVSASFWFGRLHSGLGPAPARLGFGKKASVYDQATFFTVECQVALSPQP